MNGRGWSERNEREGERETGEEETKRKSRSPRQRLEMLAGVRPVLALIFVPLFTQPPRQTIYHNEGNGSLEQNSLTPGESLQQWFCPPPTFLSHPKERGGPSFSTRSLPTTLSRRVLHDPSVCSSHRGSSPYRATKRVVIALTFRGSDLTVHRSSLLEGENYEKRDPSDRDLC